MNWGIYSLLALIVLVLGGIAGFFVYVARRSCALALMAEQPVIFDLSDGERVSDRGSVIAGGAGLNRAAPRATPEWQRRLASVPLPSAARPRRHLLTCLGGRDGRL